MPTDPQHHHIMRKMDQFGVKSDRQNADCPKSRPNQQSLPSGSTTQHFPTDSSQMIPNYVQKRLFTSMLWPALACFAFTGCTSFEVPGTAFYRPSNPDYLSMNSSLDLDHSVQEKAYYAVRQAKAENGVVLEVAGDSNPARMMPLPGAGQTVYVSDLLEETGIIAKLETVGATLYRYTPGTVNGMPMQVRMSDDCRTVRPESDYALQAGDRLRVWKAPNPAMGKLYNAFLGR